MNNLESIDAYIVRTYTRYTAKYQAARLGISYNVLRKRRTQLIRAGRLITSRRKHARPWTEDEKLQLSLLAAEGLSVTEIARRLRRTRHAVHRYAELIGGFRTLRNDIEQVRNLAQVATLLGAAKSQAYRWYRLGWLRGHQEQQRGLILVTDQAIIDFMRVTLAWVDWAPQCIADPAWRAEAERIRRSASGTWVTLKEVASRFGYAHATVQTWVREGSLPATRYLHAWYVWSADLDGFVPPSERRSP